MVNVLDPFMTFLKSDPDFSESDFKKECSLLWARQHAIDKLVAGDIDGFYVLDFLEAHGVDPVAYTDQVITNIDQVINSGARPDDEEISLYLPDSYLNQNAISTPADC